MLASASAFVLCGALSGRAEAQVVLNPPGTIPAQCNVTLGGVVAVCEVNLAAGLDADGPPLADLTVQNLTGAIAPASGINGIDFATSGTGNANLTVNTGNYGILVTGSDARGINVNAVDGDVLISNTGNVTSSGLSGVGILGESTNGNVTLFSVGDVAAPQGQALQAFSLTGNTTVRSEGTLSGVSGIFSTSISGTLNSVTHTGNINVGGSGIFATSVDADISITHTGEMTSAVTGIDAQTSNGNIEINSFGTSNTEFAAISAIRTSFDGSAKRMSINSFGDKTSNQSNAINAIINGGDGDITVSSTGHVTSLAAGSAAINADANRNNNITINSMGNVTASGALSNGIRGVQTDTGNVVVSSVGDISAVQGTGIFASTSTGNLNVQSNGKISAVSGIFAPMVSGNVNVTADGSMTASTPATGSGIHASTVFGNSNINNRSNLTDFATGLFATTAAGSVTVENSGAITSAFSGIFASTADGNAIVRNTANITADLAPIFANTSSGNLSVTNIGNLTALGTNGHALEIQVGNSGFTSITDLADSTLQGGSGTGAGILVTSVAGATDTLNTSGINTLSALSGTAITGGPSNVVINNTGVLNTVTNGAVNLGGGANAFNNRFGGVFNSGAVVNIGAGNAFTNESMLSPGGSGNRFTTDLTGNLVQTGTGEYLVDVDMGAATADLVNVSGTAVLAGNVRPIFTNLTTTPNQVTILSAAGGTTNNGLGLLASPVVQASLGFPNANDVVLNYNLDFTAPGTDLNRNQTELVNYLSTAYGLGPGGLDDILLALINGPTDTATYRDALNQLLPEIYLNSETATLFASQDFSDDLFSCPQYGAAAIAEGQCYWVRPQGGILNVDGTFENVGFDDTAGGLSAGAQIEFASNWHANVGFGYTYGKLDTDAGASSSVTRYQGGLAVKYQNGPWLLGGAVSGGIADYDTTRAISIGGFAASAGSDHKVSFVTGQARATYEARFGDVFAIPSLDVQWSYLDRDGLTETGGGAANLSVSGSSGSYFAISPAVEIGRTFVRNEDTQVRPFVKTGLTYFPDTDFDLTAQFVAAPAGIGTFSSTTDLDDLFFDLQAGVEILKKNGMSVSLGYQGMISQNTGMHSADAKGTFRF